MLFTFNDVITDRVGRGKTKGYEIMIKYNAKPVQWNPENVTVIR